MKKILLILLVFITGCSSAPKAYTQPEVNSVYYEIFVGSFYDSNGDGKGDLKGVMEQLDYIQKKLGATGIWLMPIHPSPSYHKYDVMDYMAIDPSYGTMEDFDNLVTEMEERGMDLILDLVLNHSSKEHPWFLEAVEGKRSGHCSEKCDYYTFTDKATPKYNIIGKDLYYESEFSDTMPDLNLDNELVRNEIQDITKFWLDKGVKGFRLDATSHFYNDDVQKNVEFLSWFNDYAQSIKDDVYIVGEAWKPQSIIQSMYASGISFFNFPLSQNSGNLVSALKSGEGQALSQYIENYNATIKSHNPDAFDSIFLSNHDNGRSAGYLAGDPLKQKLAASTYLLLPGNVFIYYGEEIGMLGSGKDENKRLPMLWGTDEGLTLKPSGADYTEVQDTNVKDQLKNKDSLLNHYKKVIAIRNKYPDIATATPVAINLGKPGLFALKMNDVIVVHNFSKETQTFEGQYTILENSLGGSEKNGTMTLESYKTMIISE